MRTKKVIALMAAAWITMVVSGGDSTPFMLDTRLEPVKESGYIDVTWNASWIGGDTGATVVIADNGAEVKRAMGAGGFMYTPPDIGRHELTYTTYIDGIAQDEIYRAVVLATALVCDDNVKSIGDRAFYMCTELTSIKIPNSVTDIGEEAFFGCSGLTSVTIPNSVTSIGYYAFFGCSGLTNVIFMGNAPTMDGSLFFGVASECCVYVRRGSTGWGVDIPGTWQGMRIEYLDVVEANGEAVEFEMSADGKTRTATVAEGTTTEDIKVIVGGVDVTKGFKVEVVGTTATVALKNPFEMPREEVGSGNVDNSAWTDNGDGNVTLNVEVVPGLYYAADSAATIEALKRPGAAAPAKAGDAVAAPKQEGAQGFYKVWVSDAPIEAE